MADKDFLYRQFSQQMDEILAKLFNFADFGTSTIILPYVVMTT